MVIMHWKCSKWVPRKMSLGKHVRDINCFGMTRSWTVLHRFVALLCITFRWGVEPWSKPCLASCYLSNCHMIIVPMINLKLIFMYVALLKPYVVKFQGNQYYVLPWGSKCWVFLSGIRTSLCTFDYLLDSQTEVSLYLVFYKFSLFSTRHGVRTRMKNTILERQKMVRIRTFFLQRLFLYIWNGALGTWTIVYGLLLCLMIWFPHLYNVLIFLFLTIKL